MAASYAECPKCGAVPPQPLGATDACPSCGVYMHKWQQIQQQQADFDAELATGDDQIVGTPRVLPAGRAGDTAPNPHADQRWTAHLLHLSDVDPFQLAVRAGLVALLALWTVRLATLDLASGAINGNFMHAIVLPIHEAGHMIFMPFGELLMIAGGSLFQVALPLGIALAFLIRNRDPFGAAVCAWWAAMSLVDVAPYIYDALQPQMILLTGQTGEDGPHDWITLFERLGGLRHAQRWGRLAQVLGVLLGIAALAWATAVIWLARRRPPTAR